MPLSSIRTTGKEPFDLPWRQDGDTERNERISIPTNAVKVRADWSPMDASVAPCGRASM